MSLGNIFIKSIVREVGRNYGKAVSNSLLGDKHSTPIRMAGDNTSSNGNSSRNKYKNPLLKICKTWIIKGPTATFNVAQNMYKSFFDLVEEAQEDGLELAEIINLMEDFVVMRKELNKVRKALLQLEKPELEKKVDSMDDNILEFWFELEEGLTIPNIGDRPRGIFSSNSKRIYDQRNSEIETIKSIKDNILEWKAIAKT